jgi:hypothetical protein
MDSNASLRSHSSYAASEIVAVSAVALVDSCGVRTMFAVMHSVYISHQEPCGRDAQLTCDASGAYCGPNTPQVLTCMQRISSDAGKHCDTR